MKVLASKSDSALKYLIFMLVFIFCLTGALISFIFIFGEKKILYICISSILVIALLLLIFKLVVYFKTPGCIVSLDEETNILTINYDKGVTTMHISEIKSVISRRHVIYNKSHASWGVVTINDTLDCVYVDGCEYVAKQILSLKNELTK